MHKHYGENLRRQDKSGHGRAIIQAHMTAVSSFDEPHLEQPQAGRGTFLLHKCQQSLPPLRGKLVTVLLFRGNSRAATARNGGYYQQNTGNGTASTNVLPVGVSRVDGHGCSSISLLTQTWKTG